jgi:hypothetical protein
VAPEWQATHFWPFLHSKEGHLTTPFHIERVFSPFIKQNSNAKTALRGRPKFNMLAFFFKKNLFPIVLFSRQCNFLFAEI